MTETAVDEAYLVVFRTDATREAAGPVLERIAAEGSLLLSTGRAVVVRLPKPVADSVRADRVVEHVGGVEVSPAFPLRGR